MHKADKLTTISDSNDGDDAMSSIQDMDTPVPPILSLPLFVFLSRLQTVLSRRSSLDPPPPALSPC
eukprot:8543230-Prorocentrum_lima.AAC.1